MAENIDMSEEVETESSAEEKTQKRLAFPSLNQQSDGETEIVEHVSMSDIRDKMVAWVKRMREDPSFKVVFKADWDNADHTNALAYAMKFAEASGKKNQIDVAGNASKQKIVCYTCIVNDYDQLKDPLYISKDIDYICFTDSDIKSDIWKIQNIPDELKNLDPIRQARSIKICPYKWLKKYDISIWVDGSILIKDDLHEFIKLYDLSKTPLYVRKHLKRICAYDEAKECIAQKKDSSAVINSQVDRMKADKFPRKYGLFETNILLRKHNDLRCIQTCNDWIYEVKSGSVRDQISFTYACWKNKFKPGIMANNASIENNDDRFFLWLKYHTKIKKFDSSYVTICICNFNTTDLTNNCIVSIINKIKSFKYKIVVLDNSDKTKFELDTSRIDPSIVQIIDNTQGKFIDFSQIMKKSPYKLMSFNFNNFGSLKHAVSIQFLIDRCQSSHMMLFDSDIILLNDIDFIDDRYATAADLEINGKIGRNGKKYTSFTRLLPFIQFFNVRLIKMNNIKYFEYNRIHGILGPNGGNSYDTGASFYAQLMSNKLMIKHIDHKKYVNHLDHGSWNKEFIKYYKPNNSDERMQQYKQFTQQISTQNGNSQSSDNRNINDLIHNKIRLFDDDIILKSVDKSKRYSYNSLHIHDVDSPQTMTQKIRYICAYGIFDKLKSFCSDKIHLHDFSNYVLGQDICIPIIKSFSQVDDIDISSLPNEFILKGNHGSGYNLMVKNKSLSSNQSIRSYAKKILNEDFSNRFYETHYKRIIPKIYVEQLMHDKSNGELTDYKFLCFNGEPVYCQIINDRHTSSQHLNYYDMDFNFVDICRNDFKNDPHKIDKKPDTWNEMKLLALEFSKYFDFVRVDFYSINQKIYLGELTFTPGAGMFSYANCQHDIKLGSLLKLDNVHDEYYRLLNKQANK